MELLQVVDTTRGQAICSPLSLDSPGCRRSRNGRTTKIRLKKLLTRTIMHIWLPLRRDCLTG